MTSIYNEDNAVFPLVRKLKNVFRTVMSCFNPAFPTGLTSPPPCGPHGSASFPCFPQTGVSEKGPGALRWQGRTEHGNPDGKVAHKGLLSWHSRSDSGRVRDKQEFAVFRFSVWLCRLPGEGVCLCKPTPTGTPRALRGAPKPPGPI